MAIEKLKNQKCNVIRNHMKSMSKSIQANVSTTPANKTIPYQILQEKRFEPYLKNVEASNLLSNKQLEHVLTQQKSETAREDMYILLAQRYNHSELNKIGPLPTKEILDSSLKVSSLKSRSAISLIDYSWQDLKNQEVKIYQIRKQLHSCFEDLR